jgi:predicted RNA-binding protein associated with RNAse of E/G family
MEIRINTKGNWDADLFDDDAALHAVSHGKVTVKEVEKAMVEVNKFFCSVLEDVDYTESELEGFDPCSGCGDDHDPENCTTGFNTPNK